MLTDGAGIPLGVVAAPANRNDSPLLLPTLELLSRFEGYVPEHITVHLDASYDSDKTRSLLTTLGHNWQFSTKGEPLQARGPLGGGTHQCLAPPRLQKNCSLPQNAERLSTTRSSR